MTIEAVVPVFVVSPLFTESHNVVFKAYSLGTYLTVLLERAARSG